MNSDMNSYVNFAHEIHMKFVILGKLRKNSYKFARIREGYVTNGLYCKKVTGIKVTLNVAGKKTYPRGVFTYR